MNDWISDYLERIGATRPDHANAAGLRHLQERHVLSVPFDMLAYYTGDPVPHSMAAVRKVVDERRGGSCLELNSAFGLLLRALGYEVDVLWGMIYRKSVLDKRPGHMALRVRTPEPWLVDVAQGNHSRWPLRIDSPTPQDDPHGTYLLSQTPDGDVDVARNGELLYRMESRTRDEEYGEAFIWWLRTSPKSPFTQRPVCVRPTENGRYSLVGNRFISEENGHRVVEDIGSDEELLTIYREYFGIELSALPVRRSEPSP